MFKIIFEYKNANNEYELESAWADRIGSNYKLDNILFYAPEYSLGDIVSVEERNSELYVTGLIKESGHSTVRMLFEQKDDVPLIRNQLKEMGCESEISNISTLISVDIPPDIDYFKDIKPFLDEGIQNGKWGYEESCLAHG
jgi:hypothetical protein